MKSATKLFVIVVALTLMALTPSLMFNQSAEANPWCESQKGKSNDWVLGCKGGWYDHDRCYSYSPESGDYAKGYKVGWDKGSCR